MVIIFSRVICLILIGIRPKNDRSVSGKTMPEAVIEGGLCVDDPARLTEAIVAGVGRQRAYGFGMLRLQPP